MVPGPLSVAHEIWCAVGESMSTANAGRRRPINRQIIVTKSHDDCAAKHAHQDPSAKVTDLQYEDMNHTSSIDINKYSFNFMGFGAGKIGVPNLLILCAYLNQSLNLKTLVSSHNKSLLAMHKLQAHHYFRGINLKVPSH